MSRSFKFSNNNYLDVSGITYARKSLKSIIDDIYGRFLYYKSHFSGDKAFAPILDFDDLLTTGIWTFSGYNGKYKGNPIGYMAYGMVVVFEGNNNYGTQLIFNIAESKMYYRTHTEAKIYGSFKQIF